ncbi:hypothetical protein HPB48_019509 [Haemaphysalis longicornis]|uniref:Uncharacterized protein n=1 Tax=Haemaphysalis longicornis TaxID=44386 RepID=A0A9J6FE53_HAELO|nr:hypothetical protein HPB48_019509 [Haemaphysalis longicornis]
MKTKADESKGPSAKKWRIEEQEEKVTITHIQLHNTIQRIAKTLEKKIQQQDKVLGEMRVRIDQMMTLVMQQINQAPGNDYQSGQPWSLIYQALPYGNRTAAVSSQSRQRYSNTSNTPRKRRTGSYYTKRSPQR